MPPTPVPPFQVVASGICPQGLSAGQRAPHTVNCTVIKGGGSVGEWLVTVNDPSLTNTNCAIFPSPGQGSNPSGGINFGRSNNVTTGGLITFDYMTYKTSDNSDIDVESTFFVLKWPSAEEGS